ncbi:MAG: hypothetical protein HeimC3_25430 [Candidatus Heimdallarchaeota archaeon LC_3]|nr:MAG: hypothetical protein HeimC3_25430 [Candidatus Heimdallarchaeota archaeon LC_3]
MTDFSTNELLAIYLSRYLENNTLGFTGTGSLIGMAACLIAQDLHAPDLSWVAGESGFINPSPPLVKSLSGFSPRTEATKSMNAIMRYLSRGFDFFIAEAGQIDGKARINRQYYADGSCAPGTGSTAFLQLAKKVLLFSTEHSKKVLVDKVKFVSAWRKMKHELDYTIYVTPEGVFSWKKIKNEQFPELIGIFQASNTPEKIQSITGFDFQVSKNLEVIPEPNEEEIDALKDIVDPFGRINE